MTGKKRRTAKDLLKNNITREDFLDAMQRLKFRVEKQPEEVDNLHNFVPVIDFGVVSTPNTQIIFGRNGVGKTHLLKAYYQYCAANFEENKVLPVYMDFKELQFDPVLRTIGVDDLILRFYKHFVRQIMECLQDFSERVITVNLLQKLFGGESRNRKQGIGESIEILDSALNLERIEESLKGYVRTVEKKAEGTSTINTKAGFALELSPKKLDGSVKAGVGASTEELENEKERIEIIYGGLAVIDYNAIREELETIIELSGAKAIILLIDEWSAVNLDLQAVLAELIRKTVGISNKIFLKIVALRYFTRTSAIVDPPQRIGFQMGIDITELADLDNLLNYDADKQGVKDFLTFVAYKHLCLEMPELEKYTVREFEDYLCSQLFASRDTYFELVRATEGNPRDFLGMLSSCCSAAKADSRPGAVKRISPEKVVRTAANYFANTKAPEIKNNPEVTELFQKIFQCVTTNSQKLFLVSANKAESDYRIKELWHYRFIHLVNSCYTHLDQFRIPHEYSIYSMDYGKLLSLKVTEMGSNTVNRLVLSVNKFVKLIIPSIDWVVPKYANDPQFGGKLKQIVGQALVNEVEVGELKDIQHLIDNCCIDSML